MTLEFHMQQGSIQERIVSYVRDQILKMYNKDRRISRAEIYFRERPLGNLQYKLCEIDLSILGGSMFIQRRADTFEQAAKEVVEALTRKIDDRIKA